MQSSTLVDLIQAHGLRWSRHANDEAIDEAIARSEVEAALPGLHAHTVGGVPLWHPGITANPNTPIYCRSCQGVQFAPRSGTGALRAHSRRHVRRNPICRTIGG